VWNQTGDDRVLLVGERDVVHRGAAGALPEDDNTGRITAKGENVIANPLDCRSLVEKTGILLNARSTGEPKNAQTVAAQKNKSHVKTEMSEILLDGHDYHILSISKVLAVVKGTVGPGNSVTWQ
jgi:co-chaperonin GroES (HSP10)